MRSYRVGFVAEGRWGRGGGRGQTRRYEELKWVEKTLNEMTGIDMKDDEKQSKYYSTDKGKSDEKKP